MRGRGPIGKNNASELEVADGSNLLSSNESPMAKSRKRKAGSVPFYAVVGLGIMCLCYCGIMMRTVSAVHGDVPIEVAPTAALARGLQAAPAATALAEVAGSGAEGKPVGAATAGGSSVAGATSIPLKIIALHGLSATDLNGKYVESAEAKVSSFVTYWSDNGDRFLYHCLNPSVTELYKRWALTEKSQRELVEGGHCFGSVRSARETENPAISGGWEERIDGLWRLPGDAGDSADQQHFVKFLGFLRPDYNSEYRERNDLQVQGHETYWSTSGEMFAYWCSSEFNEILVHRWSISAASQFVDMQNGQCLGMVRSPKGRDLLDPTLLKGWEEEHEDQSWVSLDGMAGPAAVGKKKKRSDSLVNRHHAHHSDHHHANPGACVRCGAKIHGPMPTPLIAHTAHHCAWHFQPQKKLEYPIDEKSMALTVAKSLCIDLGTECSGVTCIGGDHQCSTRGGDELVNSTVDAEWTYVKACPPSMKGNCDMLDPSPEAHGMEKRDGDHNDLSGSTTVVIMAGGYSVEKFRACMESLSRLVDFALFKIVVSLHPNLDENGLLVKYRAVVDEITSKKGVKIALWRTPPRKTSIDSIKLSQELENWYETKQGKDAHHYYQTFERTFLEEKYDHGIFLEEDLVVSPDFISLFRSTAWLLHRDPNLWCVSAWNDNGYRVSDACRLMRTTSFPGRGFLMRQSVWRALKANFPSTGVVTKGWDYWFRVTMRRSGKECIIPEVPRTHRPNSDGSTNLLDVALARMEWANVPTTCNADGPCAHFGNDTYLLDRTFEGYLHTLIRSRPRAQFSKTGKIDGTDRMDPHIIHILPYIKEEYTHELAVSLGHRPEGKEFESVFPQELRADHYGILAGKLVGSSWVLLVDMRAPFKHLHKTERATMLPLCKPVAGVVGESCDATCARYEGRCEHSQLEYMNSCRVLNSIFKCEKGCVAGSGIDLPAVVRNETSIENGECLVTVNSNEPPVQSCSIASQEKARLCPCILKVTTTTTGKPKPVFNDWTPWSKDGPHMGDANRAVYRGQPVEYWHFVKDAKWLDPEKHRREVYSGVTMESMQPNKEKQHGGHEDELMEHWSGTEKWWIKPKADDPHLKYKGDVGFAKYMEEYYKHTHNASWNPRKYDFVKVKGIYLEGFAGEGVHDDVKSLDESFNDCEQLEIGKDKTLGCSGITCDKDLQECTCRAGRETMKSHTGEISFVKLAGFTNGYRAEFANPGI